MLDVSVIMLSVVAPSESTKSTKIFKNRMKNKKEMKELKESKILKKYKLCLWEKLRCPTREALIVFGKALYVK